MTARLRVLVADDHVPTREDLRRVIEGDSRLELCAAVGDAAAAIEAAVRERPHVCVLDVRMPGNGVAAAWEITARLPETRVVMLTVSDDDADLFESLASGASGYLLKDAGFEQLPEQLLAVAEGGAAMSPALVARLVDAFKSRDPRRRQIVASGARAALTSREWQVLELLERGLSTAEIADELVLTPSTVRSHVTRILRKMGAETREEAIRAFRLG